VLQGALTVQVATLRPAIAGGRMSSSGCRKRKGWAGFSF